MDVDVEKQSEGRGMSCSSQDVLPVSRTNGVECDALHSLGEVAEGKSPHLSLGSVPVLLMGLLSVFQEKHLFKTPNLGMENKYQPVQHKPPMRCYQKNTEK